MASTLKVDTITTPDGTGDITFSRPIVGNLTAQKNVIINGDFNVWQRGTSFAACSDNEYQADRFKYSKVGVMVHTISRDTDVPTVAESGHLSNYSLKVDCTTIDSSIDANDECHIFTHVEGYNFAPLAQKAMTLSFWHKHTKTGTYCISVRNSSYNRTYIAEYTQTTTDTWEKATINISASPSFWDWNYTNGTGIKLGWSIAMGANWQNTADSWLSANDAATSNQVNACDNAANNFMLSQVQLEAGSVATDFEIRNHATELAMCQRYYEELNYEGTASVEFGIAQCSSGTVARATIVWATEKRTSPTISISTAGDFMVTGASASTVNVSTLTGSSPGRFSTNMNMTVPSGLAAGDATKLSDDGGGNARIKISAEL